MMERFDLVGLFIQVLNMSLAASWAALLVMGGRLLLRRAPRVFSYGLWCVVLLRLVLPFSFPSPASLMPRPQTIPQEIVHLPQPRIESGFAVLDQAVNQSLPPAAPQASATPVQRWLEIGAAVWLLVAALLAVYCVLSYLRFCHRLREATWLEGRVWESDRIPTAFVLGFLRPRVYLPLGLGEEERRYILCHEETHIRRLDHLVKPLAMLLLCVHWFNPVLWVSYLLMCRDMEMSCDEQVMAKLGTGIRKGYSASLLTLSARQNGLMTPLAFGENDVKSRIQNVLRYQKPAVWVLLLALVLGLALAFCLLTDPAEDWLPLSRQGGIPHHGAIQGESVRVERRDAGAALLTNPEQVARLREVIAGLAVGRRPVPAGNPGEDWELRVTFLQPDTGSVREFSLCFTPGAVWEETGDSSSRAYPLKDPADLYRAVEETTFLTAPDDAGEYYVSFQEVLDRKEQRYVLTKEPLIGSRLASLLLDGTLLEEKPGGTPPAGSYLFISMGNPGTGYFVYETGGRYYVERPEDYRLELTQETYQEIRGIYQTVSRRETPDETNGYYTGFEETVAGKRLRKFTSYRGETATKLAELILGGADVPLNPLEKAAPTDSYLRIEIRDPGNAYYLYQDQGRYYAEQLTNYRVELTEDAYRQIRDLYLDAATEGIVNETLSFYAEGGMEEIARVGIEGYFGAFVREDIPEELRILRFTLGEITPMAGTLAEFAVSLRWDYDTTEASRWISANGNGAPGQGFTGWHWTENYQEFRFRQIQGKMYYIAELGTGGAGQGLAPIQAQQESDGPAQRAEQALTQLLSCTVQQAEDYDAALLRAMEGAPASGGEYGSDILDYHTRRFGGTMTGGCIDTLVANRTLNRVIQLVQSAGSDVSVGEGTITRHTGEAEVYDFTAVIKTAAGETAATAKGIITMGQEGTVWKATRISLSLDAASPAGPGESSGSGSSTPPADPLAAFRLESYLNREPVNDTAPADALCAYLLDHLTQGQYSLIRRQRDSVNGQWPVVWAAVPDAAPVEALLANYPGTPAPVEYQQVSFSAAQLGEAEEAMRAFLRQNPEIDYYQVASRYDAVLVQLIAESGAVEDFAAAYPVADIYRLDVSADYANWNPDTDPDPNPTSEETIQRCSTLVDELYEALPMDTYNHIEAWWEGESVILKIAVTDEAAVDRFLEGWTGTRWNVLQKTDGLCSRGRLAAFTQAVTELDFGPGASCDAGESYGTAIVYLSYDSEEATEEAARQGMPEAVSRLMAEMDIPAQLVDYGVMTYRPPLPPGVNPDT